MYYDDVYIQMFNKEARRICEINDGMNNRVVERVLRRRFELGMIKRREDNIEFQKRNCLLE